MLLVISSALGPILLPEVIIMARIFPVTSHRSYSNFGNVDAWTCMGGDIYEEYHIVTILRVNMWMLKLLMFSAWRSRMLQVNAQDISVSVRTALTIF